MEHDNTEDLIKEIIGNREITPSDNARERFIDALSSKRKNRKTLWLRYGIAASIVLTMCFVGAKMMFGDVEISEPTPQIVNEDEPPPVEQKPLIIKDEFEAENVTNSNKILSDQQPELYKKPKPEVTTITNKVKQDQRAQQPQDAIVSIESELLESNQEVVTPLDAVKPAVPNQFIYISAEDLLAATITDSTLKLNQNLKISKDNYVESEALLLEVERQRFDEKNKGIFNKAKRELKKVKEALANRNYKNNESNKKNN
ncbi:MAG: hypothetical protein AAFX55_12250 [Bacteroidota bacterium]